MGGVTINDISEAAKLITTIIAAISALSGMFIFALKTYLKPIKTDLDNIQIKLSNQKDDIDDIKVKVNNLTTQYDELKNKAVSNRQLDSLLVKTMLLLIDTTDPEQQRLKTEIDSFLINEAVN